MRNIVRTKMEDPDKLSYGASDSKLSYGNRQRLPFKAAEGIEEMKRKLAALEEKFAAFEERSAASDEKHAQAKSDIEDLQSESNKQWVDINKQRAEIIELKLLAEGQRMNRNRHVEAFLRAHGVSFDFSVVQKRNVVAHEASCVSDAGLWVNGGRSDPSTFFMLYGIDYTKIALLGK